MKLGQYFKLFNEVWRKLFGFNIDQVMRLEPEVALAQIEERSNLLTLQGDDVGDLSNYQLMFLSIRELELEVNNGGFDQYYFNSAGKNANYAESALRKIGAIKMAEIVKRANDLWPKSTVLKNREKRTDFLMTFDKVQEAELEVCDKLFYDYPDNLDLLLFEFVKAHKKHFRLRFLI